MGKASDVTQPYLLETVSFGGQRNKRWSSDYLCVTTSTLILPRGILGTSQEYPIKLFLLKVIILKFSSMSIVCDFECGLQGLIAYPLQDWRS